MAGETAATDRVRLDVWRIIGWSAGALVLLLPLVAMHFTAEVNWSPGDFLFAGVLVLAVGIPMEVTVRKTGQSAYRIAAGLALVTGFLLLWMNGAVGITDSDADLLLALLVPAVAIVGALVARFRPRGMAITMFVTAGTVLAIGVIALITGIVPSFNSPFEILGLTGFFAVLFGGAGLLFRRATIEGTPDRS
jgi:hypothetical protein